MEKILSLTRHTPAARAASPLANVDADALLEQMFPEGIEDRPDAARQHPLGEPDFIFKVR